MSKSKKIDLLSEDKEIPTQKYVCISFLSPEGVKNCSIRGLKVRGSFSTYEEATAHAKQLQDIDKDFHVFVGEVGKWLPWDPEPNTAGDQVYRENELNNLMHAYKENLQKAKTMEAERKSEMLDEAVSGEKSRKKKMKEKLKKKLADKKTAPLSDINTTTPAPTTNVSNSSVSIMSSSLSTSTTSIAPSTNTKESEQKIEAIKKKEDDLKATKEKIDNAKEELKKSTETSDKIDENMEKIKKLYGKMLKMNKDKE